MTEEERIKWHELKRRAAGELGSLMAGARERYGYVFVDTDPRIWDYVSGCAADTDGHNLYELLGIVRFFHMLDRYAWNGGRVRRFFKFYEALLFDGVNGRQRYRLTPVQCFQFANIFGFSLPDGRRLTRLAYLFVPRKFGKTTSVASLAVYDLLFGDNNAEAYVGANSYQQAKICFNEIRAIVRCLDPKGRHFRVNREIIKWTDAGHDSLAECLAANAKTRDGLKASLVIIDEYAQARNTASKNGADLKNTLTSSMGTRREPLTVVITTASDVVDGPFKHELDGAMSVLRGETENDTMFASLFMPDAGDADGDPRTWRKVQPHIGVTVQPDYYENEWRTAQLSAENMTAFRTKMLNVFDVSADRTWIGYRQAQSLLGGFSIDQVRDRRECFVSFDLSVKDDFTAVAYMVYSRKQLKFFCHVEYYFPEGALAGHPNEQLYRRWHADGWLKLCKGKVIDVRMIADDILRRENAGINIVRIGYDAWKSQALVSILQSAGARNVLTPFAQTHGSFNSAVDNFELLVFADPPHLELNPNPINVYCLTNAVIDEDGNENRKPVKPSRYRKIDGVIAMLMDLGMMSVYER